MSFNSGVNHKNKRDFLIRDFIVPTSCVLVIYPNNHEASTGFANSLSSQVTINLEVM